jgi:excisionase family DNA binding protein
MSVQLSPNTEAYVPPRPLLTITQSARYMNCSRRTVERLIARGELVAVRVASRRRLRIEELDHYLERQRESV